MAVKIQLRRDTTANWTSVNPILAAGEPGLELTAAGKFVLRFGDGVTPFTSLPVIQEGDPSSAGDIADLEALIGDIADLSFTTGEFLPDGTTPTATVIGALNTAYALASNAATNALLKSSETPQLLLSDVVLGAHDVAGTSTAYKLRGTTIAGSAEDLIELSRVGTIDRVDVGSDAIPLQLNSKGVLGGDNHIAVNTQDKDGAATTLALAYVSDVEAAVVASRIELEQFIRQAVAPVVAGMTFKGVVATPTDLPNKDTYSGDDGDYYIVQDLGSQYNNAPGRAIFLKASAAAQVPASWHYFVDEQGSPDGVTIDVNSTSSKWEVKPQTFSLIANTTAFQDGTELTFAEFWKGSMEKINGLISTVNTHINNTAVHTTADEKASWSAKQSALTAGVGIDITTTGVDQTLVTTISVDVNDLVIDGGNASST
jgi:hypothetical protein